MGCNEWRLPNVLFNWLSTIGHPVTQKGVVMRAGNKSPIGLGPAPSSFRRDGRIGASIGASPVPIGPAAVCMPSRKHLDTHTHWQTHSPNFHRTIHRTITSTLIERSMPKHWDLLPILFCYGLPVGLLGKFYSIHKIITSHPEWQLLILNAKHHSSTHIQWVSKQWIDVSR